MQPPLPQLNNIHNQRDLESYRPLIFDLNKPKDRIAIKNLLNKQKNTEIIDDLAKQKFELELVKNPTKLKERPQFQNQPTKPAEGLWAYYPWQKSLIHILNKDEFRRLRFSRNQNLILPAEQKKFEKTKVSIAGLNVGNPAAVCLALEGGALNMKLADNDSLDLSNLNRYRAGLNDLGLNKAILTSRQITEINPFIKPIVLNQGIEPEKIDAFLLKPKIDVLIEEMDNLPLKIKIREQAKKHKIPVIMVTGNGSGIILDVERFDLEPRLPLLNGFLKESVIQKIRQGVNSFEEKVILSRDFMGKKYLVKRLRQSFDLLGSKLAGIPQLAEASFLRGAVLCYAVRQIATDKKLNSGRYFFKLKDMQKIQSPYK